METREIRPKLDFGVRGIEWGTSEFAGDREESGQRFRTGAGHQSNAIAGLQSGFAQCDARGFEMNPQPRIRKRRETRGRECGGSGRFQGPVLQVQESIRIRNFARDGACQAGSAHVSSKV